MPLLLLFSQERTAFHKEHFFMKITPNKTSYFKMPDSFLKKAIIAVVNFGTY